VEETKMRNFIREFYRYSSELDPVILVVSSVVYGVIFVAFVLAMFGCGTRAPGDPFGLYRPEELITICHAGEDAPTGRTMSFNRSMAKRHLKHHQFDNLGPCYTPGIGGRLP
jgi:hypothetical protein